MGSLLAALGVGGGAAVRTLPTISTSYLMWLAGDQGLYQDAGGTTAAVADGDPIALWKDSTVNGYDFNQTVGSKRPTLLSSALNSKPGVKAVGSSSQFLQRTASFPSFTAFECFVVAKVNGAFGGVPDDANWGIFCGCDAVGGDYQAGHGAIFASSTGTMEGYQNAVWNGFNNDFNATGWTAFRLWNIRNSGDSGTLTIRVNGGDANTHASGTTGTWAIWSLFDRPFAGAAGGGGAYATICDIILCGGVLSSGDRSTVESWLNTRYAIY